MFHAVSFYLYAKSKLRIVNMESKITFIRLERNRWCGTCSNCSMAIGFTFEMIKNGLKLECDTGLIIL